MDVKERRKNVEKLYKSGTKSEKIAKLLGISVRTVERDISFLQGHNKEKTEETILSVHREIISRREKEEEPEVPKLKRSKEVAKRRENVARLYTKGKTVREIAEELGVTVPIIYQDIRILIKEGKIEKREEKKSQKNSENEKRKISRRAEEKNEKPEIDVDEETTPQESKYMKIDALYRENKSYGEIADELNLSILEVMEYLQQIKLNKSTEAVISDRKTMVKKLYEEGKTLEEIANNLNISEALVKEDLLAFGIIPGIELVKEKGKEEQSQDKQESEEEKIVNKKEVIGKTPKSHILGIKERREKVEKLYDEGMEEEEIASKLGVSVRVVRRDIEALLDARMRQDKRAKAKRADKSKKEEEARILKRREQIERLYKEGKSAQEIAEELGISKEIVIEDIKILIRDGKLPKGNHKEFSKDRKERIVNRRKKIFEERRKKVAELYNEGRSLEEIAEKLGVTVWIVRNDINVLVRRKIIKRRVDKQVKKENEGNEIRKEEDEERRKKVEKLYNEGTAVAEIIQRLNVSRNKIYRRHRCTRKNGKN